MQTRPIVHCLNTTTINTHVALLNNAIYCAVKAINRQVALLVATQEVLLEAAGGLFAELGAESGVGLHPAALLEPQCSVNLRQPHAQRQVELQVAVVEHIAVLIAEVGDQLLNLSRRHHDT